MDQNNNQIQSASGEVAKTSLYLIVVIIIIAGAIYWYWQKEFSPSGPTSADIPSLEGVVDLSEGIAPADPTEGIPDLNPATAANPFEDTYQNPFEN